MTSGLEIGKVYKIIKHDDMDAFFVNERWENTKIKPGVEKVFTVIDTITAHSSHFYFSCVKALIFCEGQKLIYVIRLHPPDSHRLSEYVEEIKDTSDR